MTSPDRNGEPRSALRLAALFTAAFVTATVLVFFVYRVVFLLRFASTQSSFGAWSIYVAGARLDVALAAIELALIAVVFLLLRHFRLRAYAVALLVLTVVHALLALANLLFFNERYQHVWEMLIANIARPGEIAVAVQPFIETYPLGTVAGIGLLLLAVALLLRFSRRIPAQRIDLWTPRRHLRWSLVCVPVFVAASLDPVAYSRPRSWLPGFVPLPTASQFYMRYENYQANQAVINPVHDLVRFYLPALVTDRGGAGVTEVADAVAHVQSLLGIVATDSRYPLLQKLPPGPQLGLKNVIVIVVEGLGRSALHRLEAGQEITPFLNSLTRRGLYFSNIFQSYNATDGSVFSIVTGLHKSYLNQHWWYFLPTEINGYFGSIAYLLGQDHYRHLALFGFHNRREDFAGFLSNQGFNTLDIGHLTAGLDAGRDPRALANSLGLFDHVLFERASDVLSRTPRPFTAMLITATTHSPWVTPGRFPSAFPGGPANTFRYLDDSIRSFVEKLEQSPGLDETLLVITGDHTSYLFGEGGMEHLRVPLIFYSPRLETMRSRFAPMLDAAGSHVDILPTVLQLLDGSHRYSGMGVSLISPNRTNARIISGNRFGTLYLSDGYALRYSHATPGLDSTQLFAVSNGAIATVDLAPAERALRARLERDFLAVFETSARLAKDKRVVPIRD